MILDSQSLHDDTYLYAYCIDKNYLGFVLEEYNNYFYIGIPGGPIVDENIHAFMGRFAPNSPYRNIDKSIFTAVFNHLEHFIVDMNSIVSTCIKYLRDTRLKNEYVSDEENSFFQWLGFNEFYPSRHIKITRSGYLPIYS